MHFQKLYDETSNLFRLPNLFILYNKIDKTIFYGGRQFLYKQAKKAIENNYQIFKYKSYRHLEF